MRRYPYGMAALVILLLGLASGAYLAANPPPKLNATIRMWVFAGTHRDAYLKAIPAFEAAHPGVKVDLQLVFGTTLPARLQAAFLAGVDVPDVVEIEIGSAGSFFRGPLKDVGFLDLTDRLHSTGLWDKMVQARFAPYTSRGRVFGLPHDVHPVMLAYRRDLMEEAGIDPASLTTWANFIGAARKVTVPNKRYMLELSDSNTDQFQPMLFQRGGGYFDASGNCIMDNETAVQTMLWYVPLVAGPKMIANNLGGGGILTQAMESGYFVCLVTPDWRSKGYEVDIPRLSGNMALMPLPAAVEGGRRTSAWGGTMLGITRKCSQPDLAWDLAMHLYLNKDDLAGRFEETNILPAMSEVWSHPSFSNPRKYWSGQPLGKLYAELAPDVPFQYTSPYIISARNKLGEALVECVQFYKANGEAGFETFCRKRLKESADQIRRLQQRNPYQ